MKNYKLIGIIAIVAIIGLSFVACDDGNNNNNNNGGNPTTPTTPSDPAGLNISKAGTFNTTGKVALGTSYARSARAVTAGSYTLSGEIDYDGSHLTLTGSYDPVDKFFSASAAAGDKRYVVFGDDTSFAVIETKKVGANWTVTEYPITPSTPTFSGTASSSSGTAVPNKAMGWWKTTNYLLSGEAGRAIVSPYSYLLYQPGIDVVAVAVVELSGSGNVYEVTVSYYHGYESKTMFGKYKVTFTDNDTRMRIELYIDIANGGAGHASSGFYGDFESIANIDTYGVLSTTVDPTYFMVFTR
jgi:hypothetical protein